MTRLAKVFASACLSLALMAGVSATLTGCSADSLSGPDIGAYADNGGDNGGSTTGPGSEHNTDKVGGGDEGGGSTTGPGSEHNTDD